MNNVKKEEFKSIEEVLYTKKMNNGLTVFINKKTP